MPRFAANLSMLFTEVPFIERFDRAARAGFGSVEFLFPYAHTPGEVAAKVRGNRLSVVLHNLPAGDWDGGERGIACLPDRVDEFRAGVDKAIEYATALGAPQLNCLAGKVPLGASDDLLRKTFVSNLKYAAAELKKANLKLLIEPINTYDIPGFYLNRTAQAISIMDEVGADNLFLQYDIYHAQRSEGELAATMAKHLARIAHVQIADNPGRNEPGTGEINHAFLFGHLARGFAGYEVRYHPRSQNKSAPRPPDLACPMWQGEPLAGRHIAVVREQGLGGGGQGRGVAHGRQRSRKARIGGTTSAGSMQTAWPWPGNSCTVQPWASSVPRCSRISEAMRTGMPASTRSPSPPKNSSFGQAMRATASASGQSSTLR